MPRHTCVSLCEQLNVSDVYRGALELRHCRGAMTESLLRVRFAVLLLSVMNKARYWVNAPALQTGIGMFTIDPAYQGPAKSLSKTNWTTHETPLAPPPNQTYRHGPEDICLTFEQ